MIRKRNWFAGLTAVLAFTLVISGCGGNGNSAQNNTGSEVTDKGPTDLSVLTIYYQKEPPAPDNRILKEVEKRTNTKLDITWVTPNNFNEKVNVTLASGKLPDLMLVTDTSNAAFQNMAKQGAFWDLTELIKDYPNLMKFPTITFTNNLVEGKLYGVPRVRPTEGNAQPLIRTDWLEKLNLAVPTTMDELYAVMKAFKDNAPDGQKDTVGLSGYVNQADMGQFTFIQEAFTGTGGKYKAVDGKLVDMTFDPSMRDALEWLKKAYDENLIPKDFALLKHDQAKDLVYAGKAGIFPDKPNQIPTMVKELQAAGKADADLEWTPYLEGVNGKYAAKGTGHFGMFVISKSVKEEKVKKLLAFLDYGASDEGHELAAYGMEGEDFTKDGVNYVLTEAATNDLSFQFMQNIFMKYDKYGNLGTGLPADKLKHERMLIDQAADASVSNPVAGLITETGSKLGSDYDKKIQDLKTKIIMGKAALEDWDAFTAELQADQTYQQIIEEMNAAYQARNSTK
ncbi:putative aldouronate transport system substrate-binding protein [Paenibacillus endophyticus]|uniref:Putative aldouronate transport system substrate-binding protein n=1 Tax=Paenibacillus endophyticus TaxID=1294268 RepID=A0A7W5C570_9BACL|nr:extracellular solute-binding protein [Paenibacillus endophyticus]MBB3151396.1 putative aldouronate transport system substrate-binding protein [Paenibacillus endophyticus]